MFNRTKKPMTQSERHREENRNPLPRRTLGMLLMYELLIGITGFVLMYMNGPVAKFPYSFTPVPRAAYVPSSNPITLAMQGKPPTSSTEHPLSASASVRAIVVELDRIKLLAGGKLQREIRLHRPLASLQEVITAVNDRSLVEQNGTDVSLHAALIFERGGNMPMLITAPTITSITMVGPPGVFIASRLSHVTFNGVRVETVQAANTKFRSFVLASGGTMNVINSVFTGLGWDWNSSYGASWGDGATGTVRGSTFTHNFIGLYTAEARDMSIRYSAFNDNDLYGLDPHTYSKGLVIDHVVATGNRAHGIIFSDHVTASVVTHSTARHNGENGIMMDKRSTGNRVEANITCDNHGDGVVTADSPDNWVIGNTICNNRVGLRVAASDVGSTIILGNDVLENHVAIEGPTAFDRSNDVYNNGGQWKRGSVIKTVGTTLLVMLVVAVLFALNRWRLVRRDRRRFAERQTVS